MLVLWSVGEPFLPRHPGALGTSTGMCRGAEENSRALFSTLAGEEAAMLGF